MRAFRLAYDGTAFRGYQRQPHGETVEDALLDALSALGVPFDGDTPPGYSAAGRTDAGVSARAQTVAMEAPDWLDPAALNAELPAEARAWAVADVDDDFHATHDAVERHYRYFLYATGTDDVAVDAACERLSGEHDYHNLTPVESGTERDLTVGAERDGDFLVVDCRAGGFARQQVRRLVSLLEAVGTGRRDLGFVDRVLGDEPLSGPDGVGPAAPDPLVLLDVRYPSVAFEVDDDAASSASEVFEGRRRRRLAGARVASSLVPDGEGSRADRDRDAG